MSKRQIKNKSLFLKLPLLFYKLLHIHTPNKKVFRELKICKTGMALQVMLILENTIQCQKNSFEKKKIIIYVDKLPIY